MANLEFPGGSVPMPTHAEPVPGMRAEYEAALERARVVGVLDAQGEWEMCRGADGGWIVLGDDGITMNKKPESTQDAARAAAAEAIEAGEV